MEKTDYTVVLSNFYCLEIPFSSKDGRKQMTSRHQQNAALWVWGPWLAGFDTSMLSVSLWLLCLNLLLLKQNYSPWWYCPPLPWCTTVLAYTNPISKALWIGFWKFFSPSSGAAGKVQRACTQVCIIINHARRAGRVLHLLLQSSSEIVRC